MEWLGDYGYVGLFIGAFLAATLIPFSSDILLIAVLATGGNTVVSIGVATLGNWIGGLTSYGIGRLGNWERIEKYARVKRETLEKQRSRIHRYGSVLALLTWLPLVGDVFAVGLGFYKVDFRKTSLFMLIGKGARFVMWGILFHYFSDLTDFLPMV